MELAISPLSTYTPDEIADLYGYLTPEEQKELSILLTAVDVVADEETDYSIYFDDPVRFGIEVFGEQYTDDQVSVMLSVRDNPVTIAESANATGKTHAAARIAVWWFKTRDEAQVYTAAAPPQKNLEQLLWGEIGSLLVGREDTVFAGDKLNHLNIKRDSRNFITGVTIPSSGTPAQREAKFSGKHAKNLLFILDEGDAIPAEVYSGIESCLSGEDGRFLIMYNPRSNEGPIAQMKERGVPAITLSAFSHPNVITGKNIFPGALSRNKTIHRIHQWTVRVDENSDKIQGYGRFEVPDFLVGAVGTNEQTGDEYLPLPAGERIIIEPEFAYMVLGIYPGVTKGIVYDSFKNDWATYRTQLIQDDPYLLQRIESGERLDIHTDDLPNWYTTGNVSPFFDYVPDGGTVLWSMDDGYVGQIDPRSGMYTAESHPRVVGFYQYKPNGDIVRFDEMLVIQEPQASRQIAQAAKRPYESPEFVTIGPGVASLGGSLREDGYYTRFCSANVEESIKHMRQMLSADDNGHRRFKVHPRCKHFLYEISRFRRDENGRIKKQYDHCLDEARYLLWVVRHGL